MLAETGPQGQAARAARLCVLAASDVGCLLLSAALAYILWALPERAQPAALYLQLSPLLLLFLVGYAQAALYPGFGLGPVETLRRLSRATAFGFLMIAAFSFALKVPHLYSRVTFALALALSLVLVPLGRALTGHAARRWRWWLEPVVVIGTGERALTAIRSLQRASSIGYRPVAVVSLDSDARDLQLADVPVVGGIDHVGAWARAGVRVALLETDTFQDRPLVDRLQRVFRHVVLLRAYGDLPVEGLQIRNLGDVVGVVYTSNLLLHGNRILKRLLDILLGTVALVFATPIIMCAAALVRIMDGGPVLFFQDRAGLDGRRITVPKIRTMTRDAERRLQEHLNANPALQAEWNTRFKLATDPRLIPRLGRTLRRFSIDELPQLWSVVIGDMSLVGPRPFPDYHIARFSPDFIELRARVRPGITGLWQVTVRSGGTIQAQQSYDSYYIRNWSVWLDLYVLSKTVFAVASGRGAC